MSLYDCAAEMRVAWVRGKLGDAETAECDAARGGRLVWANTLAAE